MITKEVLKTTNTSVKIVLNNYTLSFYDYRTCSCSLIIIQNITFIQNRGISMYDGTTFGNYKLSKQLIQEFKDEFIKYFGSNKVIISQQNGASNVSSSILKMLGMKKSARFNKYDKPFVPDYGMGYFYKLETK